MACEICGAEKPRMVNKDHDYKHQRAYNKRVRTGTGVQ